MELFERKNGDSHEHHHRQQQQRRHTFHASPQSTPSMLNDVVVLSSSPPPPPLDSSRSPAAHRQGRELLLQSDRRSRRSVINIGNPWQEAAELAVPELSHVSERSETTDEETSSQYGTLPINQKKKKSQKRKLSTKQKVAKSLHQIPAIAVIALLNLMVSVPFGVSYFPVGWKAGTETTQVQDEDGVNGPFPLPGKEALGIRMFMFATVIAQLVYTFKSKFHNAIGLQMVENVPFCHALALIVIAEQGYGKEALSTLIFLFGLSSVIVGAIFYSLGKLELGRIVYFFPIHVLVGCIGGIGVFLIFTAMEVTIDSHFSLNMDSFYSLWENWNHVIFIVGFDATLRILTRVTQYKDGRPRFPLLSPVYFCLITPMFYFISIVVSQQDMDSLEEEGYFFPSEPDNTADRLFDMWTVIDFSTISWTAVAKAIPTMVALAAFSLIHVPLNIPAFAISTKVDTDMNAELIAHGYSNALSGIFGGLQNYMTYSNSVLYAKSGGEGKVSSLIVAALTAVCFVIGPKIASYLPRCMAGTLLLHIGIDLFLEGVYDSFGNYDSIEYAGIWVITIVMTLFGMSAALVAGVIAALSTYAMQSITYQNPIRRTMTASTLRSSAWARCSKSSAILDSDRVGRRRILLIQLHGHLFFGNVAQLTDSIKEMLAKKQGTDDEPWIVILDFELVNGMDSSAAQAVAKLKGIMHGIFGVQHTIFVTGSGEGFPCEYALTRELSISEPSHQAQEANHINGHANGAEHDNESASLFSTNDPISNSTNTVCHDLDEALIIAENLLISQHDSSLIQDNMALYCPGEIHGDEVPGEKLPEDEERALVVSHLENLCQSGKSTDIEFLASRFKREEYRKGDVVWTQGSASDSAKLLLHGTLISRVEGADVTESIRPGNILGEVGLVQDLNRLSTVKCLTESAIVYSLDREKWTSLVEKNPTVARLLDVVVIRYLTHRVQHVSNRIIETRCLPI